MERVLGRLDGPSARKSSAATLAGVIGGAAVLLACWRERTRARRQLAQLDGRGLADIGITRTDAARECAKPFWRG